LKENLEGIFSKIKPGKNRPILTIPGESGRLCFLGLATNDLQQKSVKSLCGGDPFLTI